MEINMGFGLLLVGYVLACVATIGLGPYVFAGMLVGGFLMYLGLCELKKYSPVFLYALIGSILILLCSFIESFIWIDSVFSLGWSLSEGKLPLIFDVIEYVIYIYFNFAMLAGIANLSRRVEYPETREKAFRNMYFVGLFAVYQLLMLMPIPFIAKQNGFFMTLLAIIKVIYTAINAFLLFKCYAMICPAGQEDMPRKPSRFAFVNRFREIRDAKEEKAIEDMKNYYEEKRHKKQHSKKKNGKKRKK